MRLDNLVKVSFVKGGARIPDVLNTEPARPPCHQAPQQLAANTEQELDCVPLPALPSWGARGSAFALRPLLPSPHYLQSTPGRKLRRRDAGILCPGPGDR